MQTARVRDPLVAVSLLAGVGFTAYAEYHLARAIGAVPLVAVLLPLALDVYVIAAIRRSRGPDIALSLILMGVAQISAHLLEAHVVAVSVPLVTAVSVLVPLVIWRVHALEKLSHEPAGHTVEAPVPNLQRVPVPDYRTSTEPEAVLTRPELEAVPESTNDPVPVRRTRRSTARTTKQKPRRSTARTKPSTGTFDDHVAAAREWLGTEPNLTGTDIGNRLGTNDSYGRRVKRAAATAPEAPGLEHRPVLALTE